MFAKPRAIGLLSVKFADLSIIEASMAPMSAILTRADLGGRTVFRLLVYSAAALYFRNYLLDAAAQLGGCVAGLEVLQKLEDE